MSVENSENIILSRWQPFDVKGNIAIDSLSRGKESLWVQSGGGCIEDKEQGWCPIVVYATQGGN